MRAPRVSTGRKKTTRIMIAKLWRVKKRLIMGRCDRLTALGGCVHADFCGVGHEIFPIQPNSPQRPKPWPTGDLTDVPERPLARGQWRSGCYQANSRPALA